MTIPMFATFCVMAAATGGLGVIRLMIVRSKADGSVHLADCDAFLIEKQKEAARRLNLVDGWGKALTILTVLAGIAAYAVWWLGV